METAPQTPQTLAAIFPKEILATIAAACVDPYSIKIKSQSGPQYCDNSLILKIPRVQSMTYLATVSSEFNLGIKQGLRENYTGWLSLLEIGPKLATTILRSLGLDWLIAQTTILSLRFHPASDDCSALFSYTELHTISLSSKFFPCGLSVREVESMDYEKLVRMLSQHAELIWSYAVPERRGIRKLNKWMLRRETFSGSVDYFNIESEGHGTSFKVLQRYDSEELDINIRAISDLIAPTSNTQTAAG